MFHTSAPVTAAAFHDRVEPLAALERAVDELLAGAPRWVAILGPREVGKTGLVHEAAAAIPSLLPWIDRAPSRSARRGASGG